MYHGTSAEAAALIEQGGFKASTQGLLGPGVYLSRVADECRQYGATILEVAVSVGKVWRADQRPELMPEGYGTDAPWHDREGFDTAWVPPDCPGDVFEGSELFTGTVAEEDCVWDARRVVVLGRKEDQIDEEMRAIVWCFKEDADRVIKQPERMHGCWVPYSRLTCQFIESHHRLYLQKRGRAHVVVRCEESRKLFHQHTGTLYEVRFDEMKQRNVQTGYLRGIKRVDCQLLLQAAVRAFLARNHLVKAAIVLQRIFRGHHSRSVHR